MTCSPHRSFIALTRKACLCGPGILETFPAANLVTRLVTCTAASSVSFEHDANLITVLHALCQTVPFPDDLLVNLDLDCPVEH